jgi:hypothetical protein
MHFMVITSQPLKSSIEAGKVFVKGLENPMPHVNMVGMWLSYGGEGITNYMVVEMEKGYEDEGIKALGDKLVPYYDIEGYKVNIIPVLKPDEALTMIGLTPPV